MTHTKHTHSKATAYVATFGDVTAWLDAARIEGRHGNRTSRTNAEKEWSGGTFDEAQQLGRTGWPEGRARMLANLDAIKAAATSTAPAMGFDVAGAFPDAARAAAGEPLNMFSPLAAETQRRTVVTIRAWIGLLSDVEPAHVHAWGAALASHIDAMEAAGWRLDVQAVSAAARDTLHHAVRFQIKAPEQPLDLDRLAFAIAHPAAHRRINFALREQTPIATRSSYGRTIQPAACPRWIKTLLDIDGAAIDIPSAGQFMLADPVRAAAKQGEIIRAALERLDNPE